MVAVPFNSMVSYVKLLRMQFSILLRKAENYRHHKFGLCGKSCNFIFRLINFHCEKICPNRYYFSYQLVFI